MATFTTKEYIAKLNKDIKEIQNLNRPLALAASTGHDLYVNRIFTENKLSTGGAIEVIRKTKTPRESAYSRAYARLRTKRGRQIDRVNLIFEGLLFQDIANSLQKVGKTWITGTTRPIETKKVENLIKLYGENLFNLSQKTEEKVKEVAQAEYFKIMSE